MRVLYTGDFSREEDRHLCGAETPAETPHVLICEATYGVALHMKRELREQLFCSKIHEIVARGGRCLIPVFALGRSQELRLILAPTPTLALALTLTLPGAAAHPDPNPNPTPSPHPHPKQELLLILDDHWKKHPELHGIPIYYASTVAKKCAAHAAQPSTLDPHPHPRLRPSP